VRHVEESLSVVEHHATFPLAELYLHLGVRVQPHTRPVGQHFELLRCAVGALNSADGSHVLIDELFIVIRQLGTFASPHDAAHALSMA